MRRFLDWVRGIIFSEQSDRRRIRDQIVALDLPQIVLDIFDGVSVPEEIKYWCESPWHYFRVPSCLPDFIPLWECGIELTGFDQRTGRFIKFDLESINRRFDFGPSFTALVEKLLTTLWEDDVPDERLRELAKQFAYHEIDRLLRDCRLSSGTDTVDRGSH